MGIAQDIREPRGLSLSLFNRRGAKSAGSERSEISALFASLRLPGVFRSAAALPRCAVSPNGIRQVIEIGIVLILFASLCVCGNQSACFFAGGIRGEHRGKEHKETQKGVGPIIEWRDRRMRSTARRHPPRPSPRKSEANLKIASGPLLSNRPLDHQSK
jgi:hypothetical protein